jgi:hypothetical protein
MKEYKNCTECPAHKIVSDPDPHDWFCDDDCAVVCQHTKSRAKRHKRFGGFRTITSACRPYEVKKECTVPDWCPLKVVKVKANQKKNLTSAKK